MGNKKGFTLIELLVVIGVLAVLLALTIIALNPRQSQMNGAETQNQVESQ